MQTFFSGLKPELNQLQYMEYMDVEKGKLVPYRVMDKLQRVWEDLATALNFDPDIIEVMATKNSAKESLRCLLTDWLRGENMERDDSPLTWGTLVKAMKKAKSKAVADFLTEHLDEMLSRERKNWGLQNYFWGIIFWYQLKM